MLDRVGRSQHGGNPNGRLALPATGTDAAPARSFADVLAAQLGAEGIKLSAHAQRRLRDSDVRLNGAAADRLKSAVERAEEKGARDSLVLLDDLAFVVSVKNRTVITAVEGGRARDNVFTNIDSVVIG